jgi:enamine deaminase RidA (YjgF/YER057c/UK114 family)
MTVTRHNIATFPAPQGYSHATVGRGEQIIHISGQPGIDETGAVVPGGLAAQTERAMQNLELALAAAGATRDDLVKVTVYIVGWNPSLYPEFIQGAMAANAGRPNPDVALTLIGVASLFMPEHLVEIEAVAIVGEG